MTDSVRRRRSRQAGGFHAMECDKSRHNSMLGAVSDTPCTLAVLPERGRIVVTARVCARRLPEHRVALRRFEPAVLGFSQSLFTLSAQIHHSTSDLKRAQVVAASRETQCDPTRRRRQGKRPRRVSGALGARLKSELHVFQRANTASASAVPTVVGSRSQPFKFIVQLPRRPDEGDLWLRNKPITTA